MTVPIDFNGLDSAVHGPIRLGILTAIRLDGPIRVRATTSGTPSIKVLDQAKSLGILDEVSDEGDFWEKRNIRALAEEVGEWNEMIAAFAGQMKDVLGDELEAPITDYSDFEHLEARGQDTKYSQDS